MQHHEGRTSLAGCLLAAFVVVAVAVAPTSSSPVATRGGGALDGKAKRPFCNAFTGCGRKRSDLSVQAPPPSQADELAAEAAAAAVAAAAAAGDGPAAEEPLPPPDAEALDELASRILREARLWERLQTKMELIRVLASRLEDPHILRAKRSTAEKKKQ